MNKNVMPNVGSNMIGSNTVGACQPMQQSQITLWGENLKTSIVTNGKLVAELEEKLYRVMRSETDCAPCNQVPTPEEYLVPMADGIRDATRCIEQSNARIQSLLNRCEL